MRLIDADVFDAIINDDGTIDVYATETARNAMLSMPTVDAVPVRHGKWIFGSTLGHSWMKCSECCVSQDGQTLCFSYCPNCGARMDAE